MIVFHQTVSCPFCHKDTWLTIWDIVFSKNPTCRWCGASLESLKKECEDVGT